MNDIIPIFYDHSSKKSILTFDKAEEQIEGGPDSIIKICKENNIDKCYFVSNNFHTYIQAWKNCKKEKIQLIFGLELWICEDTSIKDENSVRNEHKIIIFQKNSEGYKDLINIYTACKTNLDNKYYKFRFDFNKLNKLWTDNLILVLPFYDSFIHRNLLSYGANIVPNFPINPILLKEIDSGIPFENLITEKLNEYKEKNNLEGVLVKSIFYKNKGDIKPYTVYRCIHEKTSYSNPGLSYFSSPNFSFENYLELLKK